MLPFKRVITKKQVLGLVFFASILALFIFLNRLPKLGIVGEDLEVLTAEVQCFQGLCIEREIGTTFIERWWSFSVTYLRLVSVGMVFAFLVAGLVEVFFFPGIEGRWFRSGSIFTRTLKGVATGPIMNLCSACIVPVSSAFHKKMGVEGAIGMIQGSATMNIPALAMVFFVFNPLLGFSRLLLSVVGAVVIGPVVAMAVRREANLDFDVSILSSYKSKKSESQSWVSAFTDGLRDWAKTTIGYLVRMGPIIILAGFVSGIALQWISPHTISQYFGNDFAGVLIAATIGILINVPLLFEIPLVALMLVMGMGTAPAATLLFSAAAGGPVTFWGLTKFMSWRGIGTFALMTWMVSIVGGLTVISIGKIVWDDPNSLGGAIGEREIHSRKGLPENDFGYQHAGFIDVTANSGINFTHKPTRSIADSIGLSLTDGAFGAGVIILDYNNDRLVDILVVNGDGPNGLYSNNGDDTFTDVAFKSGVDDPLVYGNGGCAADYDNDGDGDIYISNYGPDRLFRNDGNGTFTDVVEIAELHQSTDNSRSMGCAWGDYDNDGFVDLLVVRYPYMAAADEESLLLGSYSTPQIEFGRLVLYHNIGDGTFANVTDVLTADSRRETLDPGLLTNQEGAGFQPAWVDFDNDGDVDIYIVNDHGTIMYHNVFWRNDGIASDDGEWKFTDISYESGTDVSMNGMGLAIGDYNLDANLDLYITNIGETVLLKNNGDGISFSSVAPDMRASIGMVKGGKRVTWGAIFFDYDNDGDEDLYVASGTGDQRNVLLRNESGTIFTNVSKTTGADSSRSSRGIGYLDFNSDGCLDLFVANYGQKATLLKNSCSDPNNWLILVPQGTISNRDAIGARITVQIGEKRQIREISAGSSQMGQNMLFAHFGLGRDTMVDLITIRWPSGQTQTLSDVQVNQYLLVTEKPVHQN